MMDRNKRSPSSFSQNDIEKVLHSKQGQEILNLLQADGGAAAAKAAQAAKSGDYAGALSLLQPMMNTPDSARLLKEIKEKLG